jgi:ATP synthase assembly factor FMC1
MSSIRSLYRSLLRELPPITSMRTKLHQQLRQSFTDDAMVANPEQAKLFLTYLRSQRMYVTLLERYNPGLAEVVDVQEHTRMAAKRVGLEMPEEWKQKV